MSFNYASICHSSTPILWLGKGGGLHTVLEQKGREMAYVSLLTILSHE